MMGIIRKIKCLLGFHKYYIYRKMTVWERILRAPCEEVCVRFYLCKYCKKETFGFEPP
jgi:hypothetical protein